MERLSVGLKKGGRGLSKSAAVPTTDKPRATPGKGKFKLSTSKDPLPLLTKKQPSRETKPKAKFLTLTASTEKQNDTMPGFNSFMRPLSTDGAQKKSAGFSFMKFQPKSGEEKAPGASSAKAAPLTFTSTKPMLGKFSAKSVTKKSNSTGESGPRADKKSLLKPQAKGDLPFSFRAETKSSAAKKRKAAELFANQDSKSAFPSKTGRDNSSFTLKASARNMEEKQSDKNAPTIQSNTSFMSKMASKVAAPASKRSKLSTQIVERRGDPSKVVNGATSSGSSLGNDNEDFGSTLPVEPTVVKRARKSEDFAGDATKSVSSAVPPSPDFRGDRLSGIEEELATKLLCTVDDDKEDEFLTRAAAIEEFTDRVGFEQKQLRNRLLDAHADVSESLLDALTDLMAEEGGIGIDKLDFDMNIDVDVGDAFLQDGEIQVIQKGRNIQAFSRNAFV